MTWSRYTDSARVLRWAKSEEALLKSSRQKNFEVMGGLVWQQFRYTPKSPKILGLWLADPEDNNNKQ